MKRNLTTLIAIVLTAFVLLLSGCIPQGINIDFTSFNKVQQEDESTQSIALGDAIELDIENQTGNITIKKTSDSKVSIMTKIKVGGQVQEEVDKVMNELKTQAEVQNGKLQIRAVCGDGSDFWKWKQNNYRMLNVAVTFEVSLPNDLDAYKLRLITGNITFKGLKGSIDAENITGNITLSDAELKENNRIKLITGNIDADGSIADAKKLDIDNVTGNITLSLPSDAGMNLTGSVVTGTLGGNLSKEATKSIPGAKIDTTIGDGKTDVSITLVTGNITVNSK